jgi:hypothetical protein
MKYTKDHKSATIAGAVVIIVLIGGLILSGPWLKEQYYRYQVKNALSGELQKLHEPLAALGFTQLGKPTVKCSHDDEFGKGARQLRCTAHVSKYLVMVNRTANSTDIDAGARQLSQYLDQNSWYQRKDYLTIPWFEKIGQGVDYQPDQINTKNIGEIACGVTFYTAFSKPAPAAIELQAECSK